MSSTINKTRINAAGVRKIVEVQSSSAPGVNDDGSYDFEVGSRWIKYDSDNKYQATYECTDATDGAAVWAQVITSGQLGVRRYLIEQIIAMTGAGHNDLDGVTIPAGATPIEAGINLDTLIGATTAVKVGFGISGTPSGFGKTAALTKNSKQLNRVAGGALLGVPLLTAVVPRISAVDTNGAAAGSLDSGSVHVTLVYDVTGAFIADAA